MFFKRKRRLADLEGEIGLINERLAEKDKADLKRIITEADVESRLNVLERAFAGFIKERRELEEKVTELEKKVEELSKKKLSDTMLEEEEEVSVAQILDEYLNGVEEE